MGKLKKLRVKDVFVAGGMPTVTYVSREDQSLEKNFKAELAEGFKVICVTGPTKSGKTVLVRHVLGQENAVVIEGGQIKNSDDVWSGLLAKLALPSEVEVSTSSGIKSGLNWLLVAQAEVAEGGKKKFSQSNKVSLLRYLRGADITLVVDDFHYLTLEVQRDLIRTIKSEIFDGLSCVLIAVPHRAFDAIGVEREMEGRFSHIEIKTWSTAELLEIAAAGFPKLRVKPDDRLVNQFAQEAQGSPLLMQRFCARLCIEHGLEETASQLLTIPFNKAKMEKIFAAVASQFGLPTFQKLVKGPQSRSKRIDRELRDGSGTLDRYEAVLRAVAMTGPKDTIHYDEIRDKLKLVLSDAGTLQKHEVSGALGHMSTIAREKIAGEPVLEWTDDYLYLTDPFLIFYMRWTQRGV